MPDLSELIARVEGLEIARIVDPEAFDLIAHYDSLDYPGLDTPEKRRASTFEAYPNLRIRHEQALAKADAILNLLKAIAAKDPS